MLLPEIKEREYRFKLALRMGLPIFSLILLFISHKLISDYEAIDTSFYVEILILFLFSIYFIFYIIYKSFDIRITESVSKTFTREYIFKYLQRDINIYEKYTLILISIDNIDNINNRYSIKNGDKVIREVISWIEKYLKSKDITHFPMGHIKGGDFVIGLRGQKEEFTSLVDMLFLKSDEFIVDEIEVKLSGAVTDTNFSNEVEYLIEDLFETQDRNRKNLSKNKENINPHMEESFVENAVKNRLFEIMYQDVYEKEKPIIKECFVKLKETDGKIIHQKTYMKILDKLGLRLEFDLKVLEEIIFKCNENEDNIYAINISPTSIRNPSFIFKVKKLLNKKYKIIFILHELDYYSQISKYNETLQRLRNMGIMIAIDRLGSIHTSFLYLRDLEIDLVRYDSFYTKDRQYIDIIKGFNLMAHEKGVKTWIKMIESYETLQKFKELNIDYLQGNYISEITNKEENI
ncbi:MAG: GGDEF domain-containing protein [Sulfurimonas sp.]|uniref:EAL domain-containing protein n=1 Tax=Sulfurimonas sp. TaxID=2022749 RepID=UPI00260132C7|nr:GGDEF domain-containing protein [Sulfurimonas sp.]MCK9491556.1 GGDEF domain-containing protein [Sulfurimonas sp.]